jgi:ABC-type lipoprotein export system ATPase subunit
MIADPPLIALDRVYKLYRVADTGVAAIAGVSLDVAKGEFVTIVGPSGAGKSSILNLIGGIDRATAGVVAVAGQDLGRLSDANLTEYRRRTIGFVWQGSARNLVPYLSAQDNIDLPMALVGAPTAARSIRTRELLELFGLTHCAERLPETLSGGEQQRVAVAVALANQPAILLADEPTAEIDASASESVIDAFRSAASTFQTTVVMVTHDRIAAARSDRVYRLLDGRLRASPRLARVDEHGGLTLPDDAAQLLAARDVEVEIEQGEVRIRDSHAAAASGGVAVGVIELASDLKRGGISRSEPIPFHPTPVGPVDETALAKEPPEARSALLAGRDLVRTFAGPPPTDALRRVSIAVWPGDYLVLMGPSGSGKSTLLGLLAGLDRQDGGIIEWEGSPIEGSLSGRADEHGTRVGVVFQSFGLVPWLSALENVELPLLATGSSREEANASAARWLGRLGLGDRLEHRTFELSAGQQQRVGVARALATTPSIVLADEPTADVDAEARDVIFAALQEVTDRGGAVIVATHDPSTLRYANRAVLLRDGRVEAQGSPDEIAPHVTTG